MNTPQLPKGRVKDELIQPQARLTENNLKSLLRNMNLRVTRQRLFILKVLNKGPRSHVTAKDVFETTRSKQPSMGFATVYRFLKKTSQFGITSEVRIGCAPARYELKTKDHHHHIVCTQCGKIIEFQNNIIEKQIKKISKDYHFLMEHHIFELYGRCAHASCRKTV